MPSESCILPDNLDEDHRDALHRSVQNVLATDLALETYAQIIDGLPICDIAWDQYPSKLSPRHPINDHVTLCPGVMDKAREIRSAFDITTLKFDVKLLEAYQSYSRSTREFSLRLIELTSAAVHQIAVLLFQQEIKLHDSETTGGLDVESVTTWERPPDMWAGVIPYPTLFSQPRLTAHEQYPDGVADMVGYWAEDRILGGVALFDRSQTWEEGQEPNVYFSCGRSKVTYRICQLLDDQQDSLLRFLLDDTDKHETDCPLPILPSSSNRVRIDPRDAIPVHKVYRDLWEREPPRQLLRMQQFMEPDVVSSLDYPELDVDAQVERLNRM